MGAGQNRNNNLIVVRLNGVVQIFKDERLLLKKMISSICPPEEINQAIPQLEK